MSKTITFGDEICLYALSRLYNRHIVVHTKTKSWSTMALQSPTNYENTLSKCDIHLLHMGRGIYGWLYRKTLTIPQLPIKINPVIKVKIDRRRKLDQLRIYMCSIPGHGRMLVMVMTISTTNPMDLIVATKMRTRSAITFTVILKQNPVLPA